MERLGEFHEDLAFSFEDARYLRTACADLQHDLRAAATSTWLKRSVVFGMGFRGRYADLYKHNGETLKTQANLLAETAEEVADGVKKISDSAEEENYRRSRARFWEMTENSQRALAAPTDDYVPSVPPSGLFPEPAPHVSTVVDLPGEFIQTPSVTSSDGGVSEAFPAVLIECANDSGDNTQYLSNQITTMTNRLSTFMQTCCGRSGWGQIEVSSFTSALNRYVQFALDDCDWTKNVGEAFERAGSDGQLNVPLTDSAIGFVLNSDPDNPISSLPFDPTDPYKVDSWWQGRDEQTRADLERLYPDLIRNLDGIPVPVRDRLNRLYLDKDMEELQNELDTFDAQGSDALPDAHKLDRMGDLEAIKKLLEENEGKEPPYYLMGLDDLSGLQTHAIITIGDIHEADHVMVQVPGMNTTVSGNISSAVDQMKQSKEDAEKALSAERPPAESVAAVVWIGYDSPQTGQLLSSNSVLSTNAAMKAAEDLYILTLGVQSTRDQPANLALNGHSYGSVIVLFVLQMKNHGATRSNVHGNPGLSDINNPINNPFGIIRGGGEYGYGETIPTPVTIHLDPENFSHVGNPNDPVELPGHFGSPLGHMPGVRQLPSGDTHHSYLNANTPTQESITRESVGLKPVEPFIPPSTFPPAGEGKGTYPVFVGNPPPRRREPPNER